MCRQGNSSTTRCCMTPKQTSTCQPHNPGNHQRSWLELPKTCRQCIACMCHCSLPQSHLTTSLLGNACRRLELRRTQPSSSILHCIPHNLLPHLLLRMSNTCLDRSKCMFLHLLPQSRWNIYLAHRECTRSHLLHWQHLTNIQLGTAYTSEMLSHQMIHSNVRLRTICTTLQMRCLARQSTCLADSSCRDHHNVHQHLWSIYPTYNPDNHRENQHPRSSKICQPGTPGKFDWSRRPLRRKIFLQGMMCRYLERRLQQRMNICQHCKACRYLQRWQCQKWNTCQRCTPHM